MVVTQVHAAAEFAFIGNHADLGRAILLANLDPPEGFAQRPTCRLRADFAANDAQAYGEISVGIVAFLRHHLTQLCEEGGEGVDDRHFRQLHHFDMEIGHAHAAG